jgi:hypothetical protein
MHRAQELFGLFVQSRVQHISESQGGVPFTAADTCLEGKSLVNSSDLDT